MDVRSRASNELKLAGDFKQAHKGKRSSSQFNGEFYFSALRTQGSDFNASDRRIQSRLLKNNPQIIVSGSSALLQETSKKDTDNFQDPENSLKPSSSKLRFQEVRKKPSPHRLNTCEPNILPSNGKKDSSPSNKTTELLSNKGTATASEGNSSGSREVKHYPKIWQKAEQSLAQNTSNLFNKMAKQTLKNQVSGQQANTQAGFPYADPLQGASVKFMQRISEISSQEAETKKWEQGAAKWRRKN